MLDYSKNKQGGQYLADPDAAQGGPADDALVVAHPLGSLLGTTDLGALTADPEVFGQAMKSVMEGLASARSARSVPCWTGSAAGTTTSTRTASAMDQLIDSFGDTDILGFIPFRQDLEAASTSC